jgi:transcriptional regulator with XRE-family HTH domain
MSDHPPTPQRQHLPPGYRITTYPQLVTLLNNTRTDHAITTRDLAHLTGLSQAGLAQNLRGQHHLGGGRLLRVVDALGFDLALIPREDA